MTGLVLSLLLTAHAAIYSVTLGLGCPQDEVIQQVLTSHVPLKTIRRLRREHPFDKRLKILEQRLKQIQGTASMAGCETLNA